MTTNGCWAIEDYTYRPCPQPSREFGFAISLHNHSRHSIENLASLNQVVKLWFMRPFSRVLQRAFGLEWVSDLDYAEVYYRPPLTVEDVFLTESAGAALLGFDSVHLGITDHDEVAGSIELLRQHPANAHRNPLGEELSLRFQNYLFHLGDYGLARVWHCGDPCQPAGGSPRGAVGRSFRDTPRQRMSGGAESPAGSMGQGDDPNRKIPVEELLRRYGWAIHALEYNGMRGQEENDRVLQLAKHVGKPVIGGGDSHLLLASSVLSVSQAREFPGFRR